MHKVFVAITGALLLAGILAWHAEATTLSGVATVPAARGYSLVEKAGLFFGRRCPRGMHQICTQRACACGPALPGGHAPTLTCTSPKKKCYRPCWADDRNQGVTLCAYCAKSC